MTLLHNTPLLLSLFSIVFAQFVKVPIHLIVTKKLDWSLMTSTGGMPSSHSAAVTSLTTAIGYETGLGSPTFAVAAMFAGIVMYDATGIRYQAGQHAIIINRMRNELTLFFKEIKHWPEKNEEEKIQELKTLLGHKPSEVLFGALTGIVIAVLFYSFFS